MSSAARRKPLTRKAPSVPELVESPTCARCPAPAAALFSTLWLCESCRPENQWDAGPGQPSSWDEYREMDKVDWDEFEQLRDEMLDALLPRLTSASLMALSSMVQRERRRRNAFERAAGEGTHTDAFWKPFVELRRREHIDFEIFPADAPALGGLITQEGIRRRIFIRYGRWSSLTHELTHDDRGLWRRSAPLDVVDAEEDIVNEITRERLNSAYDRWPAPSAHRVGVRSLREQVEA